MQKVNGVTIEKRLESIAGQALSDDMRFGLLSGVTFYIDGAQYVHALCDEATSRRRIETLLDGGKHTMQALLLNFISDAAQGMLHPKDGANGLDGIGRLEKVVLSWKKLDESARGALCAGNAMEIRRGEGMYRTRYGDFLLEADAYAPGYRLSAYGNAYRALGEQWLTLADALDAAATDETALERAACIVRDLYQNEKSLLLLIEEQSHF